MESGGTEEGRTRAHNLVAQRHPFEGRGSSSLPDRKCLGFQRRSFAGSIWKQFRHQARSPRIRDLIHSHSLFRGCIGGYSFSASIAIHGTRSYTPPRSGILHSHGNMLTGSLLIVRAYPREQSPGPEKTRQEWHHMLNVRGWLFLQPWVGISKTKGISESRNFKLNSLPWGPSLEFYHPPWTVWL